MDLVSCINTFRASLLPEGSSFPACVLVILNENGERRHTCFIGDGAEDFSEPDWSFLTEVHRALALDFQASGCTANGRRWAASTAVLGLKEHGGILVLGLREAAPESDVLVMSLLVRALVSQFQSYVLLEDTRIKARFDERIIRSLASGFVVLLPEDMYILHINPAGARILGGNVDDFIGRRLDSVLTSKLRVLEVFNTGKPIIDEEMIITLHDRSVHIIKTAVPVFDDGKIVAILDVFNEIKEVRRLVNRMAGSQIRYQFEDIIHVSESMAGAIEMGSIAAESSLSVLITGESGTGKELFAQAIHGASSRKNAPFVVIDCASMPRDLVESELFGYMEGAFTGALKGGRPGKFELADGGTVFLDELGELPIELQSRLLRVLQSRRVTRLGGQDAVPVDIRVIAATNRNLMELIKTKGFRDDLYYRLNVLSIHIPPLRSRPDDILLLASHFLQKYQYKMRRHPLRFTPDALRALQSAPWPGNVRELENAIARAVQVCNADVRAENLFTDNGNLFDLKPLPQNWRGGNWVDPSAALDMTLDPKQCGTDRKPSRVRDMESDLYLSELERNCGNISRTARSLGVARSTIYKKVRMLGFDIETLCEKLRKQENQRLQA